MNKLCSNIYSVVDMFFKQVTELGSLTIITAIIIFTWFYSTDLALKLFIAVASVTIISFAIKTIFPKDRPRKQKFTTLVEKIDASSFPSVHSARITVLTFWLALISTNILLQIFIIAIGVLVAYSRIYLKKHYYIDVFGGIILGVIINLLIYYLL